MRHCNAGENTSCWAARPRIGPPEWASPRKRSDRNWQTEFVSDDLSAASASPGEHHAPPGTGRNFLILQGRSVIGTNVPGNSQLARSVPNVRVLFEIFLTSWRSTWGRVQAGRQRKATSAAFLFFSKNHLAVSHPPSCTTPVLPTCFVAALTKIVITRTKRTSTVYPKLVTLGEGTLQNAELTRYLPGCRVPARDLARQVPPKPATVEGRPREFRLNTRDEDKN